MASEMFNVTMPVMTENMTNELKPVINDAWFLPNHITSLASLSISIIISTITLIYIIRTGPANIWKRKTGERLVVYLAICDLLFRYVTRPCTTQLNVWVMSMKVVDCIMVLKKSC